MARAIALIFIVASFLITPLLAVESWPQFRGPDGNGTVAAPSFPLEWGEDKNVAWKLPIPGSGWAQPVVWDDKVFVCTAITGDGRPGDWGAARANFTGPKNAPDAVFRWELWCVDLKDGHVVWKQQVAEQKPEIPTHATNTYATETPATDGQRVYLWLASIGQVFAYNMDGTPAWAVDLGVFPMNANLGTGSSPVLHDGLVFVQCYNEQNSFLVALEAATGQQKWKADRSKGTSWSTPYLWRNNKRIELVACGNTRIYSYDPATGSVLWELGNFPSSFSATPAGTPDALYLGNNGPFSSAPLFAVLAGQSGDISLTKDQVKTKDIAHSDAVAWWRLRSGPGLASPVVAGGRLFVAAESILSCYDPATGERLFRERLPAGKDIVASPLVLGDKIILIDEDGSGYVVAAEPALKILATNKLDDVFWSSPAVAGNSLLLRGVENLYCIRAAQ